MSNLQLRIVSAIVLAAAVLGITWLGGLPFRLLSTLILLGILFEWSRMTRPEEFDGKARIPVALTAASGLILAVCIIADMSALLLFGLTALFALVLLVWGGFNRASRWDAAGLAYAALAGILLAKLRDATPEGLLAILFLFSVVWATDILAYFVGRALGGPKLAPAISPGKTWSGAIGGAVGGVLAGLAIAFYAGIAGFAAFALVALLLSIVSQIGDLFESWVKRRNGVKDSGWIIPGHGGVMDRVDGLVAAAFALYLIGALAGGPDHPAVGLFAP